jgi:hypothetical protein
MGSKTTKTVKVDRSTAEEWASYVDENAHVDTISHLIRLSVNNYISSDPDPRNRQASTSAADSSANSGDVLTHLRKIQTAIGDLEERVAAVEDVESAEAGYSLKKAVWELLPEEPGEVIDDEIPPVYADDGFDSLNVITARELAQRLGADARDVEDTLDELVESTGQVERSDKNHDGNHYWKKGQ